MKKPLLALSLMAMACAASAQSSVTLYGIVDAALAFGQGSVADRTQLASNGYNSNRLGLRGNEDLGGGLFASFFLEGQFSPDTGAGGSSNTNNQASGATAGGFMFNRRATLSIGSSGWGEIRLGRDYVPQFSNLAYEAMGLNGVGTSVSYTNIITGVTAVRASNSVGYFLPKMGGFYGQAMYYLGENASNAGAIKNDGNGYGIRFGYAAGALDVAVATGQTKYAAGNVRQTNVGAKWNFGAFSILGNISSDANGALNARGFNVGTLVPVGNGTIRAAYSRYRTDAAGTPTANKLALGYVYDLSKRTAVYGTFATVRNSGGASTSLNGSTTAANASSKGLDIGIRHTF